MRISVELVPRSAEALEQELSSIKELLPAVNSINIPDLPSFPIRSWTASVYAKRYLESIIPHLRAIDIDATRPLPMAAELERAGIREVLVVAGETPDNMSRTVYSTSSLQLIRKIRRELPEVKVYATLDPYRQSLALERDYALAKLDAGASGLFTQPFFDLRLMAIYADLLGGVEIFWGATSVTNERSLAYWQNRNKAIFPSGFTPSLAWSRKMAQQALDFAKEHGGRIYFMPIRTRIINYLQGVLGPTNL